MWAHPRGGSKGAKLQREAQTVVSPAPHTYMLDVVIAQSVMAQQGGLVGGQVEQGRALARSRCFVSACSISTLSIHSGRLSVVRMRAAQRTAQPVARPPPNPSQQRLK